VTQKPLTLEERGLFHLNDTEMWHQLSLEKEGPYEFWSETTEVKWLANLPTHTIFTPYDTGLGMLMRNTSFFQGFHALIQANEDLSLFVQTVIQETGSPARAMQALQHVIFSNRYYRYLPMFSTPTGQAVTYNKEAIQPVRIRGYVAVMIAIGVHILTVFYILMVFGVLQGTRQTVTSINQAWQVFAQVSALQRELGLEGDEQHCQIEPTTATDRTIEKDLKQRGLKDRVFVLDEVAPDGVIQFREIDEG